ncbi:hypothetical protein [Streptomyces violaceusniger]
MINVAAALGVSVTLVREAISRIWAWSKSSASADSACRY